MITEYQISWLKEFLLERSLTEADKESSLEIVESFKKMWLAIHAGRRFRDLRTNEALTTFCAALETLKTTRNE